MTTYLSRLQREHAPKRSQDEAIALGKSTRSVLPRNAHAAYTVGERDPLAILAEQNATRVDSLISLRIGRMLASPFTFYRGTAAIMTHDLARGASTGFNVISCGDAHISNFGLFGSPQRSLVFDLNDFDEAGPAPWEWDVKRFITSVVIGARDAGYNEEDTRATAVEAAQSYRHGLLHMMDLNAIDRFYFRLDTDAPTVPALGTANSGAAAPGSTAEGSTAPDSRGTHSSSAPSSSTKSSKGSASKKAGSKDSGSKDSKSAKKSSKTTASDSDTNHKDKGKSGKHKSHKSRSSSGTKRSDADGLKAEGLDAAEPGSKKSGSKKSGAKKSGAKQPAIKKPDAEKADRSSSATTASKVPGSKHSGAASESRTSASARVTPTTIAAGQGLTSAAQRIVNKAIRQARKRTSQAYVEKISTRAPDGTLLIIENPPVLTHVPEADQAQIERLFERYRRTVAPDIAQLLSQFHLTDVAMRVVGVGSVGTRCYILILTGPQQEALVLQVKEAQVSVLENYGGIQPEDHRANPAAPSNRAREGNRVVNYQRILQAVSDPFLGYLRFAGRDYYVRQFRDMKGSIDTNRLKQPEFVTYVDACGTMLARAHAQSPNAAVISGYLGNSEIFDHAVVDWAFAYADQSLADYRKLQAAVAAGTIEALIES